MYTPYLETYQYHFPTESDRAWLEQTLTGQDFFTASDAINVAASCNTENDQFRISRIISRQSDNQNLCWTLHDVNKSAGYIQIIAICTHPDFRGQGITKHIGEELTRWQKTVNPWNLNHNIILFDTSFINSPKNMYGDQWQDMGAPSVDGLTIQVEKIG